MAKLVTVVRTYFGGGYRNNTIEIDIPDEAAELIKEHWAENGGVYFNTTAKFLASNQTGNCFVRDNENDKDLAGLFGMHQEETQEEEVFKQSFKDWEDEDDE